MEQIRNEAFQAEADLPPAVYKGALSVDAHQGWHSWPGSALRAGRPCSLLLCTDGRRPIPSICSTGKPTCFCRRQR